MSLFVAETNLTVSVETPCVKSSLSRQRNSVTETSLTSSDLGVMWELNLSGSSDFSEAAKTKLAHFSLTP